MGRAGAGERERDERGRQLGGLFQRRANRGRLGGRRLKRRPLDWCRRGPRRLRGLRTEGLRLSRSRLGSDQVRRSGALTLLATVARALRRASLVLLEPHEVHVKRLVERNDVDPGAAPHLGDLTL
jgi:hypothetical protein